MTTLLAIAAKDLRLLLRDRGAAFFTVGFPLVMAIFFGVIFSGGGDEGDVKVKIAVVDEDKTPASAAFVGALASEAGLDLLVAPDRAAAAEMVRTNAKGRTAYVVLPKGMGDAGAKLFAGETTTLEIGIDPSRAAEAGMLEGILMKRVWERLQGTFGDPQALQEQARASLRDVEQSADLSEEERALFGGFLAQLAQFGAGLEQLGGGATSDSAARASGAAPTAAGWQPFRIEKSEVRIESTGPGSAFAISFPQGVVWALIGCSMSFVLSLVSERLRGTLVRLRVAPIGRGHVLAGKALACFVTAAVVSAALLLLMTALGVRPHSLPLLLVAVTCASVCFVGLTIGLAALARTEASAAGLGWAVMLVSAMIGGGMVPLFVMPGWMQTVSIVSPIRWTVLALEGAIWRGYSGAEMLLPCGVLLAVGAVAFSAGVVALRRRDAF